MAAIVAYPVLKALMARMDHRRYNGAALLGLRGLVFKSHGSADARAYEHALNRAHERRGPQPAAGQSPGAHCCRCSAFGSSHHYGQCR